MALETAASSCTTEATISMAGRCVRSLISSSRAEVNPIAQLDNMFISQQANACVLTSTVPYPALSQTSHRAKAPEPEEEEDELPFGCYICRETWDAEDATPPIVTRCGHFFHQKVRSYTSPVPAPGRLRRGTVRFEAICEEFKVCGMRCGDFWHLQ